MSQAELAALADQLNQINLNAIMNPQPSNVNPLPVQSQLTNYQM